MWWKTITRSPRNNLSRLANGGDDPGDFVAVNARRRKQVIFDFFEIGVADDRKLSTRMRISPPADRRRFDRLDGHAACCPDRRLPAWRLAWVHSTARLADVRTDSATDKKLPQSLRRFLGPAFQTKQFRKIKLDAQWRELQFSHVRFCPSVVRIRFRSKQRIRRHDQILL